MVSSELQGVRTVREGKEDRPFIHELHADVNDGVDEVRAVEGDDVDGVAVEQDLELAEDLLAHRARRGDMNHLHEISESRRGDVNGPS